MNPLLMMLLQGLMSPSAMQPGFGAPGGAQGSPAPAPGQADGKPAYGLPGAGTSNPQLPGSSTFGGAGNGIHLPIGIGGAAQGNPFGGNPLLAHLFSGLGVNRPFYGGVGNNLAPTPGLGILGPLLGSILGHSAPQQPGGGITTQPVARQAPPAPTPGAPVGGGVGLGGRFPIRVGPMLGERFM